MRQQVLAIALFLPLAATAADWWQGNWAENLAWCAQADHIGYALPTPISITADETLGYGNRCTTAVAGELTDASVVQLTWPAKVQVSIMRKTGWG